MQRLEVSGAVRTLQLSLGVKGLIISLTELRVICETAAVWGKLTASHIATHRDQSRKAETTIKYAPTTVVLRRQYRVPGTNKDHGNTAAHHERQAISRPNSSPAGKQT
jgi:hypothetical protein